MRGEKIQGSGEKTYRASESREKHGRAEPHCSQRWWSLEKKKKSTGKIRKNQTKERGSRATERTPPREHEERKE